MISAVIVGGVFFVAIQFVAPKSENLSVARVGSLPPVDVVSRGETNVGSEQADQLKKIESGLVELQASIEEGNVIRDGILYFSVIEQIVPKHFDEFLDSLSISPKIETYSSVKLQSAALAAEFDGSINIRRVECGKQICGMALWSNDTEALEHFTDRLALAGADEHVIFIYPIDVETVRGTERRMIFTTEPIKAAVSRH